MKSFILCLGLLLSFGTHAQKEAVIRTTDKKVVNEKLVRLQTTLKNLETTLSEATKIMDKLRDQKDSLSEMKREDMMWMQQLMEKKSQLEQMISNVMKAESEVKNNIAKNLKA